MNVTVSLQEKNGIYQAVLNYKDDKRKKKTKMEIYWTYNKGK